MKKIDYMVTKTLRLDLEIRKELQLDWPSTSMSASPIIIGPSSNLYFCLGMRGKDLLCFAAIHVILSFRSPKPNRAMIEDVWVRPAYRKQGLAKNMLNHIFEYFANGEIYCMCIPSLPKHSAFYQSVGAKVTESVYHIRYI